MTINLIQHASSSPAAGLSGTITISASGTRNLIIVLPSLFDNTITVTSITDNAPGGSNLYIQVPGARATDSTGGSSSEIWYCANSKPKATTITVNFSSSVGSGLFMFEVSNMNSSLPFQEKGIINNGASSSTPIGAAVTTSNPLDFIANVTAVPNTLTNIHSGNNFIFVDQKGGNADSYIITSQKGTYTPQYDQDVSGTFCSSTASFREAPHSIDLRGTIKVIHISPEYYEG
jgi:hypothetical protein